MEPGMLGGLALVRVLASVEVVQEQARPHPWAGCLSRSKGTRRQWVMPRLAPCPVSNASDVPDAPSRTFDVRTLPDRWPATT